EQVGRVGGVGDEQPLGPSSFDIAPDGSIDVADWVHERVVVLTARGAFRRAIPLPVKRPVDIAADGRVAGRYEVETGVAERVALTPGGPHVWVGPAQWAPVRSRPGVPL